MSCKHFLARITGYIDDELSGQERNAIEAHLRDCPSCEEAYLSEKRVKELVHERAQSIRAPASLQRRIRRQLVRSGEVPSFGSLIKALFDYRPLAAGFAVAVLALLVLLPTFGVLLKPSQTQEVSFVVGQRFHEARLKGEIICLDCEFLTRKIDSFTHPARHRPGIKTENGVIWTFVRTGTNPEFFETAKLFHKQAVVSGILFEDARYISVKDYQML